MIRTLTDSVRATQGYGGPAIAGNIGIDIAAVAKDIYCPSGSVLASYRSYFLTEDSFSLFIKQIISEPSGSALDGRLTWRT